MTKISFPLNPHAWANLDFLIQRDGRIEFSQKAHISLSTVSRIWKGKQITQRNLENICAGYELSTNAFLYSYLFKEDENILKMFSEYYYVYFYADNDKDTIFQGLLNFTNKKDVFFTFRARDNFTSAVFVCDFKIENNFLSFYMHSYDEVDKYHAYMK